MPDDSARTSLSHYCDANKQSLGRDTPSDFRFRYIDLSSIDEGSIDWSKTRILSYANSPSRARRVVQPGDVLFSTVRPGLMGHALVRAPADFPIIGSTGFAVLSPKADADGRFIFHSLFLDDCKRQVLQFEVGSNYPAINESDLLRVKLGKVDKPNQDLIADILDAIDDAIIETDALIAKLLAARLGFIEDLLTRGIDEGGGLRPYVVLRKTLLGPRPSNWEIEPLGRWLGNGFVIQIGPFGSQLHANEYTAAGIPVVMPQDIRTPNVITGSIAYISIERANQLPRHRVVEGDLVLSRRGELDRIAIIESNQAGWICGTGCLRVRCDPGVFSSPWLAYYYNSPAVQRQLKQIVVGSTMLNMNSAAFGKILAAVPPLSEQIKIAKRIRHFEHVINEQYAERDKLAAIRHGLRDDLLTGRVSVAALAETTSRSAAPQSTGC